MIEYCHHNVDGSVREQLRSAPEASEFSCLEHCGICDAEPFVVVDGEMRRGADHDELLAGQRSTEP